MLNLGVNNEDITKAAEELYQDLLARGIQVLFDDRDERPGSKFKDADLIGIPFRVTVGKTYENEGKVEIRSRKDGKTETIEFGSTAETVADMISAEMAKYSA